MERLEGLCPELRHMEGGEAVTSLYTPSGEEKAKHLLYTMREEGGENCFC
jgi:hypothetical protein